MLVGNEGHSVQQCYWSTNNTVFIRVCAELPKKHSHFLFTSSYLLSSVSFLSRNSCRTWLPLLNNQEQSKSNCMTVKNECFCFLNYTYYPWEAVIQIQRSIMAWTLPLCTSEEISEMSQVTKSTYSTKHPPYLCQIAANKRLLLPLAIIQEYRLP